MDTEQIKKNLAGLPIQKVKIDDIMDDPLNPNVMKRSQLDALEYSMTTPDGNAVPIIVNKVKRMEKPYMVVDGHQRLKILRKWKMKMVPAVITEKSLSEARAFGVSLNTNRGENDPEKLSNLLHYLWKHKNLELLQDRDPHFTMDIMHLQIDKFHDTALGQEEEVPIPKVPRSTKTKLGDIYQLGQWTYCPKCKEKHWID